MKLVPDRPARIVLYVRVSSVGGRSGDRFHSPQLQADAVRALAEARGMTVVGVVEDLDVSGRTFTRAGIQRVMEMAKAAEVEAVGLYDLSRLGRNTGESLRTIAELRDLGVSVLSTVEQIDDSPEGQFMLGQFLGMAQLYSDQIGRRWTQIHERRHDAGLAHAGKVPLGYLNENGQAVVDPVLGPLVTWAFRSYLAGTVTQRAIAARLTEARGKLVRQGTVSNLLRNPFHAGQVMWRRERRQGIHPALIDEPTFAAVQRKLARDLRDAPRRRGPVTCLSGLVLCDTCEKPLSRRGRGREGEDGLLHPRFRCPTPGCEGVGAPFVADVEQAVLEQVLAEAEVERDGVPSALSRAAKAKQARTDRVKLERQHRTLLRQIDTATEKLVAGVIDDGIYARVTGGLRLQVAALEQQIADALDSPVPPTPGELASAAERIRQQWDRMTAMEQRATLSIFFERVWLRRASYRGEPVADRLLYPEEPLA